MKKLGKVWRARIQLLKGALQSHLWSLLFFLLLKCQFTMTHSHLKIKTTWNREQNKIIFQQKYFSVCLHELEIFRHFFLSGTLLYKPIHIFIIIFYRKLHYNAAYINFVFFTSYDYGYPPTYTIKSLHFLINRLLLPIGIWNIKDLTLSRQPTHRWQLGCQPCGLAALYHQKNITSGMYKESSVNMS
jgi:hypothetical protein